MLHGAIGGVTEEFPLGPWRLCLMGRVLVVCLVFPKWVHLPICLQYGTVIVDLLNFDILLLQLFSTILSESVSRDLTDFLDSSGK